MNPDRLYTFLLSDPRFDPRIQSFGVYLMSVFDRLKKCAVEEDSVKKSQIPRLRSRRISVTDAFSCGNLPVMLKKAYQFAQ